MELNTCLETALAMKKAERINFKKYELGQEAADISKLILKKTPINIHSKK